MVYIITQLSLLWLVKRNYLLYIAVEEPITQIALQPRKITETKNIEPIEK